MLLNEKQPETPPGEQAYFRLLKEERKGKRAVLGWTGVGSRGCAHLDGVIDVCGPVPQPRKGGGAATDISVIRGVNRSWRRFRNDGG